MNQQTIPSKQVSDRQKSLQPTSVSSKPLVTERQADKLRPQVRKISRRRPLDFD